MSMTLTAYFNSPDAMNASQLAAAIGVSRSRITQLRGKDWPPELALEAERVTGGRVDAGKLSPVIAKARETGEAA
jgi:DNA-binding transcriptional regulator YdaS (Cro superfamily)